jgi:hypothetical protein
MKGSSRWGDAYLVPQSAYNLISYRSLRGLGYAPTWGEDTIAMSKGGHQVRFVFERSTGLYQDIIQPFNYSLATEHYSVEQRRRVVLVKELHERTNHASLEQMVSLSESTCLLDSPLTGKDIRIGWKINGPCNACRVGKFTNPPSLSSTSTPTSGPGELLHTDI